MQIHHIFLEVNSNDADQIVPKKQVSMGKKYHNHTPQTNPWHHKEDAQNTYCPKISERQLKQSNQPSLPHPDDDLHFGQ